MKFVGLVSGGKDSFYAIMESIRNGHELVACAHLSPRAHEDGDEGEMESYMYQTAASECIPMLVEECLGVPLILRQCVGRSKNTSLVYDKATQDQSETIEDEVEDLFELLAETKRLYPEVIAVSSGAILSTYQRTRIESVCGRLQLTPLGFLWRVSSQRNLLQAMLEDGIHAVLVKVASPPGLLPRKHLNKTISDLFYGGTFDRLKERFNFQVCGEGGEYETLVLDCPIFKKKLELTEIEIIESDDGVGHLVVKNCRAVEKDYHNDEWKHRSLVCRSDPGNSPDVPMHLSPAMRESSPYLNIPRLRILPKVKVLPGGLAHVSEIISQDTCHIEGDDDDDAKDADMAVLETKCIFETLKQTLKMIRWCNGPNKPTEAASSKDVVFVHLYLSNISHFAAINMYYGAFFGTLNPPSRSCVAVGSNVLPGGRRVMIDCLIQRGSGEFMRVQPSDINTLPESENSRFLKDALSNPHHNLRSTLHVQTISHWAPVCIGPYSQANTLRSGVIFCAGQIGLVPETMRLIEGGWKKQLEKSWENAASVLDALGVSLRSVISGIVYIGSDVVRNESNDIIGEIWNVCSHICHQSIDSNGLIIAGLIDENIHEKELYGGYEDYETYKEVMAARNIDVDHIQDTASSTDIPLLMVAVPQLPAGAHAEVELISATNLSSTWLSSQTVRTLDTCSYQDNDNDNIAHDVNNIWDLGYDGNAISSDNYSSESKNAVEIHACLRCIGNGCFANVFVVASLIPSFIATEISLDMDYVLSKMLKNAVNVLEHHACLNQNFVLHVRLFYDQNQGFDGSTQLRHSLRSQVYSIWTSRSAPATSVVPVDAIYLSKLSSITPFLAMQIISADLIHMETEMWIHNRTQNK